MTDNFAQQDQTFRFFNQMADDWRTRAEGRGQAVNVIGQRNQAVLEAAEAMGMVSRILDIGCGTGELALAAAEKGIQAHGIDFAPEMVALCERSRKARKLDNASFETVSVFAFSWLGEKFDIVSALGFIEYISPDQLDTLLEHACDLLRSGGALVLGSRNRLFNVFSLNAYSRMEMELGAFDDLAEEARIMAEAESTPEALTLAAKGDRTYPQPESHPDTGVSVSVRHQYTPGELAQRVGRHGFEPYDLVGVHYHGMPPSVAKEWPSLHVQLSETVYTHRKHDHRLVPQCSTFLMTARKL